MREIGIIVAADRLLSSTERSTGTREVTGVIARGGALPWESKADLAFFKSVTLGGTLICGVTTRLGMPETLPGRDVVVVSRSGSHPEYYGDKKAGSLAEAIAVSDLNKPIWVVGGAALYNEAARNPGLSTVIITEVEGSHLGPHQDGEEVRIRLVFPLSLPKYRVLDFGSRGCDRGTNTARPMYVHVYTRKQAEFSRVAQALYDVKQTYAEFPYGHQKD